MFAAKTGWLIKGLAGVALTKATLPLPSTTGLKGVVELLRGAGVPVMKSAPLLLVSAVPWLRRKSEVVLLPAAAAAVSKSFAVPNPTKSESSVLVEPLTPVIPATSATLPPVAEKFSIPVASAVGKFAPAPAAPTAC